MATKKAAPKRKAGKPEPKREARKPRKPAKPKKRAPKKTVATSRKGKGRVKPRVVIGRLSFLGATYRVETDDPGLQTRQIKKLPSDKVDIRAPNGKRIVWTSTLGAFKIVFDQATPPDTEKPEQLVFRSSPAGSKAHKTDKVELRGQTAGSKLSYEIYLPPDAKEPLDPSIIIDPAFSLRLVREG
jgi:hypothetical protein